MNWVFPEGRRYGARGPALSGHDVAQVCLRGHVITQFAQSKPDRREAYCSQCGAATIMACVKCQAPIRGYYHVPNVHSVVTKDPPAFCHACGEPHPWTAARLRAAQDLAQGLDELSPEERQKLSTSLAEVVSDTPATAPAAQWIKKILAKLGQSASDALNKLIVEIASETAKKMLSGKP